MDMRGLIEKYGSRVNPKIMSRVLRLMRSIPPVRRMVQREYEGIIKELEAFVKPYRDRGAAFPRIPETGWNEEKIIEEMEELRTIEESKWRDGFASGAVYHGNEDHIRFLNTVYAMNSQSNPLHSDIWPSAFKYESEIVSMTANMLGAGRIRPGTGPDSEICGVVTSGGTESILLAMKTYRDWARDKKGIKHPEIVVPSTAHAAFDKAAQYFNMRIVHVPVDGEYKADLDETRQAISRRAIALVGSAPSFPHGIIDPIEELSEMAKERGIGFHTDACLGGFVLPWAERLGYDIPPFDFRLPGVTSMSADTHKYGYAAKGTSVVLYRGLDLRHYQYFKATEWPGGLYFSPTFAGSRPGALSAVCWAAMVKMGENGYAEATDKILKTALEIRKGIGEIPDLYVLGNPLWVIAFGSRRLDIYRVMDYMTKRKWSLNGLHKPPCVHICVTLRHTLPGVSQRFLSDLRNAVAYVQENPEEKGGMAPVYGMAASIPDRSLVAGLLDMYIDMLYRV